jgi:hypothetical protein
MCALRLEVKSLICKESHSPNPAFSKIEVEESISIKDVTGKPHGATYRCSQPQAGLKEGLREGVQAGFQSMDTSRVMK